LISITLGLITALVYGFCDFFGAIAAKKIRAITVTALSSIVGLALLLSLSGWLGINFTPTAIFWGLVGGAISAIAINSLYTALAIGPISIASPLTAVLSAIVPAVVGVSLGDQFSGLGWLAIGLILVAVVLVGFIPGDEVRLPSLRGLIHALVAGIGIGFVMVCLDAAPRNGGVATIVVIRIATFLILGVASLISFKRRPNPGELRSAGKLWWAMILAGLLESLANVLFTVATQVGTLTVVAVLTALFPLGTILLARVVLKEKIAKVQLIGIFIAIGASALLAFTR
jgi:drug/metabolite transporter (DMT)-like permease